MKAFEDNAIDCEIVNGQHAGNRVFIPRIPLSPSKDISLPFKFKRKQFPIRLCFGMTINKAQGQTIPNVGSIFQSLFSLMDSCMLPYQEVFPVQLHGC